jgi:hypothetical protein
MISGLEVGDRGGRSIDVQPPPSLVRPPGPTGTRRAVPAAVGRSLVARSPVRWDLVVGLLFWVAPPLARLGVAVTAARVCARWGQSPGPKIRYQPSTVAVTGMSTPAVTTPVQQIATRPAIDTARRSQAALG